MDNNEGSVKSLSEDVSKMLLVAQLQLNRIEQAITRLEKAQKQQVVFLEFEWGNLHQQEYINKIAFDLTNRFGLQVAVLPKGTLASTDSKGISRQEQEVGREGQETRVFAGEDLLVNERVSVINTVRAFKNVVGNWVVLSTAKKHEVVRLLYRPDPSWPKDDRQGVVSENGLPNVNVEDIVKATPTKLMLKDGVLCLDDGISVEAVPPVIKHPPLDDYCNCGASDGDRHHIGCNKLAHANLPDGCDWIGCKVLKNVVDAVDTGAVDKTAMHVHHDNRPAIDTQRITVSIYNGGRIVLGSGHRVTGQDDTFLLDKWDWTALVRAKVKMLPCEHGSRKLVRVPQPYTVEEESSNA